MSHKKHGQWTAPIVLVEEEQEKPDYRSRMSAKVKRPPVVINYQPEEVRSLTDTIDDSQFLRTNILT